MKQIALILVGLLLYGCGWHKTGPAEHRSCAITIEAGMGVNGVHFGDSIEKAKATIPGDWPRVDLEAQSSVMALRKMPEGKNVALDGFLNGGVGYQFVNNKLASVYQDGDIAVCYRGKSAFDVDGVVNLFEAGGFTVRPGAEHDGRRAAFLQRGLLTIAVYEEKATGKRGVLFLIGP